MWIPNVFVQAIDMLRWMRETLQKRKKQRGGRSHHEQSAVSKIPFDGKEWPWAATSASTYKDKSVRVSGCAVGLLYHRGDLLLPKEWCVESTCPTLLASLAPYVCSGGHAHGASEGHLARTAIYTPLFATVVYAALANLKA